MINVHRGLIPNTIAQASQCIDQAVAILSRLNSTYALYYPTILTTIYNQTTVLKLTTILSTVFLHHTTRPKGSYQLLSWVDSISFDLMHTVFTQIINNHIPTMFMEPSIKTYV